MRLSEVDVGALVAIAKAMREHGIASYKEGDVELSLSPGGAPPAPLEPADAAPLEEPKPIDPQVEREATYDMLTRSAGTRFRPLAKPAAQ